MTSTDTIRTVIEIVPGFNVADWECGRTVVCCDWGDNEKIGQIWNIEKVPPLFLDALAAAAVRVVNSKRNPRYMVYSYPEAVEIVLDGCIGDDYVVKVDGPNETENRLEAIAEFVKGGGFDVDGI